MNRLPEILPAYKIEKSPLEPFAAKWEELQGWMLVPRMGEKLIAYAKEIVAVKSADSLISLFILSVFCGVMMYIAAEGTRRTPYGSTFQLSLVMLPVAVFILCGFEHCVADVYYYALAGFSWDALLRILIIIAGNSLGSILLHIGVSHHEPA